MLSTVEKVVGKVIKHIDGDRSISPSQLIEADRRMPRRALSERSRGILSRLASVAYEYSCLLSFDSELGDEYLCSQRTSGKQHQKRPDRDGFRARQQIINRAGHKQ